VVDGSAVRWEGGWVPISCCSLRSRLWELRSEL